MRIFCQILDAGHALQTLQKLETTLEEDKMIGDILTTEHLHRDHLI